MAVKKVLVLVEGQSELIFVRNLFIKVFDLTKIKMHAVMGTPDKNNWREYKVKEIPDEEIDAIFVDSPSGFND